MKIWLKVSPILNEYLSPWNFIKCRELLKAKQIEHKSNGNITEYIIYEIDDKNMISKEEMQKLFLKYEYIKEIPKDVNKKW